MAWRISNLLKTFEVRTLSNLNSNFITSLVTTACHWTSSNLLMETYLIGGWKRSWAWFNVPPNILYLIRESQVLNTTQHCYSTFRDAGTVFKHSTLLTLYLFLRGELCPALRPSITCGPMRNPDITKGKVNRFQVLMNLKECITSTG